MLEQIPDMKLFEFVGGRVCSICARTEHYVYLTRDEIEKYTVLLKETTKFPIVKARLLQNLLDTFELLRMSEDKGRL